jgi:SAM-dependent methyltransferase
MQETPEQIRLTVKERFARVACSPHERHPFAIGPQSAKALGYDAAEIDGLPAPLTESFAGVGNPLALAELRVGDTVLDLGSGAGLDSILAARRVGPAGRVIGVDMTAAMVEKARANAASVGAANVEFRQGEADRLPVGDGIADVVISNGVFNLCPDKPKVVGEIFRVLKPGGRLQMADILLEDGVTPEEVARKGAWSD